MFALGRLQEEGKSVTAAEGRRRRKGVLRTAAARRQQDKSKMNQMASSTAPASGEPVSARTARLNALFLGKAGAVLDRGAGSSSASSSHLVSRDGLLDALFLLYDECIQDETLRNDVNVAVFIDKFRPTVREARRLQVNISDFEVKRVIGRGHFGEVQVVREKQTGDVYAMKSIRKGEVLSKRNSAFFEEERDIMAKATSPWLTGLQYAFQDAQRLYLVMDFHPGGDLLALLDRFDGRLRPDMAQFYLAEMALGIHALHLMGYAHRDIKPENVLLDRCGHLKLADFGSAARLGPDGMVTGGEMPVGTPDYIAPEVLAAMSSSTRTYGSECDHWSLGIVAYEMMYGSTPFSGDGVAVTCSNIINHRNKLQFPDSPEVSSDYKDLVASLLTEAGRRLKHDRIMRHKFFIGIQWSSIGNMVPPFVPHVSSQDDTSNFDEFETRDLSVDDFPSGNKREGFSGQNLPFVGFTFIQQCNGAEGDASVNGDMNTTSACIRRSVDSQADLDQWRKECRDLQSKLRDMELGQGDRCSHHSASNSQLQAKIRELEQEADNLHQKATEYKTQVGTLNRHIALEHKRRAETEEKAVEMINGMKARWKREEDERMKAKEWEIEQEKENGRRMEDRAKRAEERSNTAEQDKASLMARIQDLQSRLSKSKERRRSSIGCLQTKMEAALQSAHQRAQELQLHMDKEVEVHAVRLTEKDKEVDLAKAEAREAERKGKAELEELEQQSLKVIDGLESQAERLRQERDELRTQLIEMQALQQRWEAEGQLRERLAKDREDCAHLRSKLSVVESQLEESHLSLEHQEQSFVTKERQMEDLVSRLQAQIEEVEAEKFQLSRELQQVEEQKRENQARIHELEQLFQRLESNVQRLEEKNTDTPSPQDLNLLQQQIEKLEGQLEKSRELLVLEREKTKSLETELRKKEKEAGDTRLDLRMAEREAKGQEQTLKRARDRADALAKKCKEAEEAKERVEEEKEKIGADLDTANMKVTDLQRDMEALRADLQRARTELDRSIAEAGRREAEAGKAKEREEEARRAQKKSEAEAKAAQDQWREAQQEVERVRREAGKCSAKVQDLLMNNNVLKDTCTMFDEQLKDFETLVKQYDGEIVDLEKEKSELARQCEELREDARKARQMVNEEKSLRAFSESKAKAAEQRLESIDASSTERQSVLEKQLEEYREMAQQLVEKANTMEAECGQLEVDRSRLERDFSRNSSEVTKLKEEVARELTRNASLRESNCQLTQALEDVAGKCEEYRTRVMELEAVASEVEAATRQRETKMEATLSQQTKLIQFLQDRAEEAEAKRKKTLTEKLFGSVRHKENTPPTPIIGRSEGHAPFERKLHQEREKCRVLEEELIKLRATLASHKSAGSATTPRPTQKQNRVTFAVEASPIEPAEPPPKPERAIIANVPGITRLDATAGLQVNCALQLTPQIVLLGTSEGLQSLHLDDGATVCIAGVSGEVTAFKLAEDTGVALLLVDGLLVQTGLVTLIASAQAQRCSKPAVEVQRVDGLSQCVTFDAGGDHLCVATPSKLCLLRWDPEFGNYTIGRSFSTPRGEPCTCVLLTGRGSLLASSNRLLELDLTTESITIEDFLDPSDSSLIPFLPPYSPMLGCPMAVVRIGPEELLICFSAVGLFVDAYGSRTREKEVGWKRPPKQFAFEQPYLFVFHSDSAEVIRVTPKAFIKDSDTTPPAILDLPRCKYLGAADVPGSVYVGATIGGEPTIVKLVGREALKDEDGLSFCSISTASDGEQTVQEQTPGIAVSMESVAAPSESTDNSSLDRVSLRVEDEADGEFSFSGSVAQELDSISQDTLSVASDLSAASSSLLNQQVASGGRKIRFGNAEGGGTKERRRGGGWCRE